MMVELSRISLTGWNPRKNFDGQGLEELKQSIREYGILEPLLVRTAGDGYELVAGERRFRAARELGLETVPIVAQELDDRTVKEIMLLENLQREDLSPLEEAAAIHELLQDGVTQEELGRRLGKSQAWIANRLRLLQAPDDLKQMLISREISPKHIITLLPFTEYRVYEDIVSELKEKIGRSGKISVKALEDLIESVITAVYNSKENVFCLDWQMYDVEKYMPHFDFSKCNNSCKHIVRYEKWGEDRRYCLNRRCWKDKVNLAKQAFEKQRSKDREKLAAKGEVDLSKLNYSVDYHLLKYAQFDTAECESCENCKLALDGDKEDLVCLDVSCYEKMKRAWTREQKKAARKEEKRAYETLDEWLDQKTELDSEDLRLMLRLLTGQLWAEQAKKALQRWGKTKTWEDLRKVVEDVPEEDLHRALLRLVVVVELDRGYGPVTMERLKNLLSSL